MPRAAVTIAIFAATLALIIKRPRGLHESWWASLGALAMLALGLVTPRDARDVVVSGKDALLFLLALLVLSALVEKSGFFEWASIHAARLARGDGRALYRNVFVLGALITAALSLDTTAVILTPLVLAFVRRLELPARPYVLACAFVANNASLFLPVSNLTNLLFTGAFHLSFRAFAARMLLPQLAALLVNYALFRRLFRAELPARFDPAKLPDPASVVPHRGYFLAAASVLGVVLLGYFLAPFAGVEPYAVGGAGAALLLVIGLVARRVTPRALGREIAWGVFPFVVGLFIVVHGVEHLGLGALTGSALTAAGSRAPFDVLLPAGITAVGSNLVNNLPAALLARGALLHAGASAPVVHGALLGTNLGPNVTLVGSLATLLVLSSARKKGADLRGSELFRVGLLTTPLILLAAGLVLSLSFVIVP